MAVEAYQTVRYRCTACRKSWASKTRATKHALTCVKDPANRGCGSCRFDGGVDSIGPGEEYPYCAVGVSRGGCRFITKCARWEPKAHLVTHLVDVVVADPPKEPAWPGA